MTKHRVVGIDLGTTYSAVAAFDRYTEAAEIILNTLDGGKDQTVPSVVSLNASGKVIVGEVARRSLTADPRNTIIEVKREMGEYFRYTKRDENGNVLVPGNVEKYNAQEKYEELKQQAIRENRDPDKIPAVVPFAGQWFRPQEISAFILMKMKQIATAALGEDIRDAVITVPAYFHQTQRKATEEAALLAGLYPRQLIPEPTAAAICYGVDRPEPTRKVYLIYDLGGGTFDVSIITVENQNIEVIAASGDPRLGGGDFDDLITEWAVAMLKQHHGLDVGNVPSKLAVIKYYAEKLKRELSSAPSGKMTLPELRPEAPPILELSRTDFERMLEPKLQKSLTYVELALKQAKQQNGLDREHVDGILLVGGSSKIPRVKEKLLEYFQKDEEFVRADCDPDAVVARGAAMVALKYQESPPPFDISSKSVGGMNLDGDDLLGKIVYRTEHSLGVGVQNNLFHKIIEQGSRIPVSITHPNFTNAGPTKHIEVRVYQGESQYVFENSLIGMLQLGPMEEKPEGYHKFEVTFSLDQNGLLTTEVHHVNEGKRVKGDFKPDACVGGVEALEMIRKQLLAMYDDGQAADPPVDTRDDLSKIEPPAPHGQPAAAVAPGASGTPAAPYQPVPGGDGMAGGMAGSSPQAPQTVPQGYAQPAPTVPPTASPSQGVPQQAVPTQGMPTQGMPTQGMPTQGMPTQSMPTQSMPTQSMPTQSMPTSPPADGAAGQILQPTVVVPEKHESIVRRAQKQLLRRPDPELLRAFNALVQAINEGRSDDERSDLHDELEDAYIDSRR